MAPAVRSDSRACRASMKRWAMSEAMPAALPRRTWRTRRLARGYSGRHATDLRRRLQRPGRGGVVADGRAVALARVVPARPRRVGPRAPGGRAAQLRRRADPRAAAGAGADRPQGPGP